MQEVSSKKKLREFGLLIGFGFPILIGWLFPLLFGHPFRQWTIWIGFLGLSLGIFFPRSLYFPYKFWMKLGHVLGWANSRIILGFIFIIVLQPIALLMKIIGYDPLRKKKLSTKTYREEKLNRTIDLNRIF